MRTALVFGGSGQIGRPLLDHLRGDGWRVLAVSREPRIDAPGLQWLRGSLEQPGFAAGGDVPRTVDAIFSCGPLDHFARWYAGASLRTARVLAFGSTSIEVKRGSADAGERDVAARLREGERVVVDTATARGAAATLLRPTLVYGAGSDQTLSRIVAIARRWHRFVLPRDARGLRQPVHVRDLAGAAFAATDREATHGQIYALPGGETLAYRDMVARVLAVLQPPATLIEVPSPLFNLLLGVAQTAGHAQGFGEAAVKRMRSDLVFDITPAARDFGYAPRRFQPTAEMFDASE
jgi:nucleoside-diphosphate-sugar epimerase